jgi:hypothetical protein
MDYLRDVSMHALDSFFSIQSAIFVFITTIVILLAHAG